MRKGYMAIRLAFQNFSSLGTKECTMLVLTRKAKEEIRIGNDITVTIVRVKGRSVRVGINAPEHVHVMRSELVTPNDAGTDSRGLRRQPCDGGASSGDSRSDSSGNAVATDAVEADHAVEADGGHSTSRDVDVATEQPQAIRADKCGCRARRSPIGSTTVIARVVACRRQNRLNPLLPPR